MTSIMKIFLVTLFSAVFLLLSACGDDEDSGRPSLNDTDSADADSDVDSDADADADTDSDDRITTDQSMNKMWNCMICP